MSSPQAAPAQPVAKSPADMQMEEMETLLNAMLAKAEKGNTKGKLISNALMSRERVIEEVLPPALKGQAGRLIRRASMTFATDADLAACPPDDFIRCVIRAAELGLAIDGRLAYVVLYKSKFQVQIDYKGLLAIARRSGAIAHCKPDIVRDNDEFELIHVDGRDRLKHRYGKERNDVILGAYASFVMPDGHNEVCYCSKRELDAIMQTSPSYTKDWSPWKKWPLEMMKKSAVRRGLKLHCDDMTLVAALDLDEEADVFPDGIKPAQTVDELGKKLGDE